MESLPHSLTVAIDASYVTERELNNVNVLQDWTNGRIVDPDEFCKHMKPEIPTYKWYSRIGKAVDCAACPQAYKLRSRQQHAPPMPYCQMPQRLLYTPQPVRAHRHQSWSRTHSVPPCLAYAPPPPCFQQFVPRQYQEPMATPTSSPSSTFSRRKTDGDQKSPKWKGQTRLLCLWIKGTLVVVPQPQGDPCHLR